MAAVSQPPLRPDAPNPANAASSTMTRKPGWACFRYQAVHNPVNPAPTMQTSASAGPGREGRPGGKPPRVGPQRATSPLGLVAPPVLLPYFAYGSRLSGRLEMAQARAATSARFSP